jgi:nucleoside-diphosphate-sugar epimerase
MKALVLGGGGFIGGHLVEDLVKRGYCVRAVDVKLPEFRKSVAHEFVLGDLRDPEFVHKIMKTKNGFDEVYQLAADMGGATYINCGFHDADVMSNSVTINVNVAKACVEFKAKKLFFSSSACVYHTETCQEDEAYPASPDNEYGWEKLFTERMLRSFQRQYGLEVRIARFHSTVGDYATWDGGKEKAHSALARKVAMVEDGGGIEVIGDGSQLRTFMYVKDCVEGIRRLMDSDVQESINIGSDHLVSINQYLEVLKKISGKNFKLKYVEGATGTMRRGCDLTKARALLGWEPVVSLEEATRITYDWIREQLQLRVEGK